jgi:hypothetical protein
VVYKGFLRLTIALIIFTYILAIFFVATADGADLISQVVYEEARGESLIGQVAVAEVIRNRVNDPWWADTYEGVIYQENQFALPRGKSDASAEQATMMAVKGSDIVKGAQYFFNPDKCQPEWADDLEYVCTIENHVFMRRKEEQTDRGTLRVLQYGDRGTDVEALQEALEIEVDGIYGRETYEAVKEFQEDRGLVVDGIAGTETLTKIQEITNA